MKIISQIDDVRIRKAVLLVTRYYKDDAFLDRINAEKFNHTKDFGGDVAYNIEQCQKTFYIIPYTHWNPFSRTLGHFENPNYIVNMRKINALTLKQRTENIFHECLGHGLGYGHKGNYVTAYNLETVPYKASRIFVEYLSEIGAL